MSASLLKKSLKLIEDDTQARKKSFKKLKQQQSKRKKILNEYKQLNEKQSAEDINKKIQSLQQLNCEISLELSEKILARSKKFKKEETTKTEESTVFSEADFEAFEKEYFVS